MSKERISVVVLCKDEGYELGKCIRDNRLVELVGCENIFVVCSSEGENAEVERMICGDLGVKFVEKRIGDSGIKGIGDLRNYGGLISESDWVLYIDVDELFSVRMLEKIGSIVKTGENCAYRFPRINLPWYEGYPDYQTRLVNIKRCIWIGDVHESVGIIKNVDGIEIKGGDFGVLKEYPIIHKDRGMKIKGLRNSRWDMMGKRNVLVCSLFKDSEWCMDRFFECIEMINLEGSNVELCFIEGNSDDNTWGKLREWKKKFEGLGMKCFIEKMDINEFCGGRFDRLGILRNMLIKVGLKSKHDYVLMVDSDVVFSGDLLVRLVSSIERENADVMGCMVMIEGFRTFGDDYFYDTLAFTGFDGSRFVHYFPYIGGKWDDDKVIKGGCLDVKSVGTCYLVRGDVYNLGDIGGFGVVKCYNEVEKGKNIVMYKGEKKSEQLRWCDSMRNAGYKVMVDSSIKVLHANLEKYGRKWH